jgi:hypothetical protein
MVGQHRRAAVLVFRACVRACAGLVGGMVINHIVAFIGYDASRGMGSWLMVRHVFAIRPSSVFGPQGCLRDGQVAISDRWRCRKLELFVYKRERKTP